MKLIMSVFFILMLSACEGGSSSPNAQNAVIPSGTVKGTAFDSLISNGTVNIYDFSSGSKGALLANIKTDADGLFAAQVKLKSMPLLIEVKDGSYIEEAGGAAVNLSANHRLTLLINFRSGDSLQVAATVYTHLATGLAVYLIQNGKNVSTAIDEANSRISALTGFDIVKTIPKLITDANNASASATSELKYGFLAGAISMWTKDHAPSPSLEHFYPYSSIDFAQLIYDDISVDGILDGYGIDANGVRAQLVFSTTNLSSEVYRFQLGAAILKMATDVNNKSTLDGAALLPFAKSYLASSDLIFNNVAPTTLDAPLISINAPFDGSWMRNSISVTASVTSKLDLKKIELLMDGVSISTQLTNLASPSFNLDTLLYSDGGHDLSIKATDISGMNSTKTIRLNISNTPATVTFTNPVNGAWLKGILAIQGTASSPVALAKSDLLIDGVFVQTANDPNLPVFSLDTSAYADGQHVVGIQSTDVSGLSSTTNIQISFDNAAPLVNITSPALNTWLKGVINIGTTVSSANNGSTAPIDLVKAELIVDGIVDQTITANLINPIFQLDTARWTGGAHVISFRATNSIAKVSIFNLSVNFDNIAPIVTIQTPGNNIWLTGSSGVTASVQSDVSILNVELLMDGVSVATSNANVNSPSFTLDTTAYTAGSHTLGIKANDIGGLTTTTNVPININNSPPVVAINSPALNSWQKNSISVNTTNSSGVALIKSELLVDGVLVTSETVNLSNPVFTVDTTAYSNGAHTFSVTVTDIAGLVTTNNRAININNALPVVSISSPSVNGYIGGVYDVTSTVQSAAPITLVELLMDGAVVGTTTLNTTTPILQLNAALYTTGPHTLGVRATDLLGFISLKNQAVNINNIPPSISITSPGGGWLTGTITISGSATSASGLSKAEFLMDGSVIGTINSPTLSPSLQIAAASYSGVHTIGIRVTDMGGLVSTATKSVSIDGVAPTGSAVWQYNGTQIVWSSMSDSGSGFSGIYFNTTTGNYSSINPSGAINISSFELISVYVYDVAGNSRQISVY